VRVLEHPNAADIELTRVLYESGVIRTRTDGPTHMNELRRDDLDRLFPGLLAAVLAPPQPR
jgi:hypothetical protein